MLDVHVAISKSTPDLYIIKCLDSVYAAQQEAGYEVNVFLVDGVKGHIGKAREKGFSFGYSPFVSWVDDDDWVTQDAFYVLREHLIEDVAIRTLSTSVYPDKQVVGSIGLTVLPRRVVQHFAFHDYPYCGHQGNVCSTCFLFSTNRKKILTKDNVYYRRQHTSAGSLLRSGEIINGMG